MFLDQLEIFDKMHNEMIKIVEANSLVPNMTKAWMKQAPSQQKEEDMCYATAATINVADNSEKEQRRHLRDRLINEYEIKKYALKKKFGLVDDEQPKNVEEALERIKDGKFVVTPKEQRNRWFAWYGNIEWRDPSVKKDEDGYVAAKEPLMKAYQDAETEIRIKAPLDGLDTLKKFQALEV